MSNERPTEASDRPDALGSSRHSRLSDQIQEPTGSLDLEEAAGICAEVSRTALADLAPALVLLATEPRRRLQALVAYTMTLYDFARQRGLDGERLAQINRWEFELESALDADPVAQPVFLLLAQEEKKSPWSKEGLKRLNGCARRRIAAPQPGTVEEAEREAQRLSHALAMVIIHPDPSLELVNFGAALLRLSSLRSLGEGIRRHDVRIARSQLPDNVDPASPSGRAHIDAAIQAECKRLRPILDANTDLDSVPREMRRGLAYARMWARSLLSRIEQAGSGILERPPRLGIAPRLGFLLRSRIGSS